jgi:hypothetical protein
MCDYAAIEHDFLRSGKQGLMTVFRNDGQWDTSNVEFADGRVLAYSKKDRTERMRYIDYGLGVFRVPVFEKSQASDLADVYANLLRDDRLTAVEVHQRFYEIGSSAGLHEMEEFFMQQRDSAK